MPPPLDLAALMAVPHVDPYGGYEVAPDGSRVAFAWNRTGNWEIYEASLDGIQSPRQISSGPGAKFAPRYSPAGRHLAYVLDVDGCEAFDLFVCDLETGEQANLTPATPEALQPSIAWSPVAGDVQLAYLAATDGRFSPYVVDLRGGAPRLVWRSPFPAYDVDWSPDGRWLAVTGTAKGQDYCLSLVAHEGGEVRAVGDERGPLSVREGCWAPEPPGDGAPGVGGMHIAFVSDACGTWDVGIYALQTGQVTWVSAVVLFLNWFTSHENVREDIRHWDMEIMGDPVQNHALWRERSPFFFLDRIRAPVQLICGAHDVRCPAVDSLESRDTLLALGKEVSLTLYADEGHSFRRLENVIDAEKQRAAFLAAVLDE